MGATQDKIAIKKNGVNMIQETRKGENESMFLYLNSNIYAPEGSKPQESNSNVPEEKKVKYRNDKK